MRKTFLQYVKNELESKRNILSSNMIGDTDKAFIESQIEQLDSIVSQVEAMETEDTETIDELKSIVADMGEKVKALGEKIAQSETNIEPKIEETMNYLETKNSVSDFCNAIRNSRNSDEFRSNWYGFLTENGVTVQTGSEQAYLPEAVKGRINDIWEKEAGWLNDLTNTGAKRFYVRHNVSDQNAEAARAKGWKKGTDKVGEEITVSAKLIEPQFIYKIQSIDLKTKFDSDDDLLNYVMGELVSQILYEIKRAILVGDGRATGSDYKIDKFETIAKQSSDNYTTVISASGAFLIDDMVKLVNTVKNPNDAPIYLFMNKSELTELRRVVGAAGATPVYIDNQTIADQIGVSRIYTTDLLGGTTDYKAIAMIPSEYYLVGENILNPSLYQWHEGWKNIDNIRYECVAGGGINRMKSTAVLKATE